MKEYTVRGHTIVVENGEIIGHLTDKQKMQLEKWDESFEDNRESLLLEMIEENKYENL